MVRDLRNRAGALLLLCALVVVSTSCFQASVGLEVADDGSGKLVVDLVPSPALLETVGGTSLPLPSSCRACRRPSPRAPSRR